MKNSNVARFLALASVVVVFMGMFLLSNAFFWGHDSITGNTLVDISPTDTSVIVSLAVFYIGIITAISWATPTRSQVAQ